MSKPDNRKDWQALQNQVHEEFELPAPGHSYGWDFDKRIEIVNGLVRGHVPTGARVLDAGCWTGMLSEKLVSGYEVHGIDSGAKAVAKAQAKGIQAKLGDLHSKWDFKPSFFDCVLLGEIIEHVLEPGFILREAFRVLKSGGLLVLTTPNRDSVFFRHAPDHYKEYNYPELAALLGQSGFQIQSHSAVPFRIPRTGFFVPWLHDLFPALGRNLIVLARKP